MMTNVKIEPAPETSNRNIIAMNTTTSLPMIAAEIVDTKPPSMKTQ
jgi:hypothetical protein